MEKKELNFNLQFPRTDILDLAARYAASEDTPAIAAGERIASADFDRRHLENIFLWKTKGRGKNRLAKNTDDEIADALDLAQRAKTPRAAISVLTGLSGVDISVASAILAVVKMDSYTLIDWRVLQALGIKSSNTTVKLYLAYLQECRRIADEEGITLRTLDRAMWQWSKEKGISQRALN